MAFVPVCMNGLQVNSISIRQDLAEKHNNNNIVFCCVEKVLDLGQFLEET